MFSSDLFSPRVFFVGITLGALLVCASVLDAGASQKNNSEQGSKKLELASRVTQSKAKSRDPQGTLVLRLSAENPRVVNVQSVSLEKKPIDKEMKSQKTSKVVLKPVISVQPEKKWIGQRKISAPKKIETLPQKIAKKANTDKKELALNLKPQKPIKAEVSQPRIIQARIASDSVSVEKTPQDEKANNLIQTAYRYLKTAYRMGGTSPNGFDCSGFTRFIFAKHGIDLPRSSVEQSSRGLLVDQSQLKTGDLVFFSTFRRGISHVGIFIANGLFIHSSGKSKGVSMDSLFSKYWKQRYRMARRVDLSGARQYAMLDEDIASKAG